MTSKDNNTQTCLGKNMTGYKRVWSLTWLGTNVFWHKHMPGHRRVGTIVWAQACMGTVMLEQEPGGFNLAEKVTNFDMVSNDLHI